MQMGGTQDLLDAPLSEQVQSNTIIYLQVFKSSQLHATVVGNQPQGCQIEVRR